MSNEKIETPKRVLIGWKLVPYQPHYRICRADGCLRVLNKHMAYCLYHKTYGPGKEDLIFD